MGCDLVARCTIASGFGVGSSRKTFFRFCSIIGSTPRRVVNPPVRAAIPLDRQIRWAVAALWRATPATWRRWSCCLCRWWRLGRCTRRRWLRCHCRLARRCWLHHRRLRRRQELLRWWARRWRLCWARRFGWRGRLRWTDRCGRTRRASRNWIDQAHSLAAALKQPTNDADTKNRQAAQHDLSAPTSRAKTNRISAPQCPHPLHPSLSIRWRPRRDSNPDQRFRKPWLYAIELQGHVAFCSSQRRFSGGLGNLY